jgi:hypothetical protein
LAASSLIGSKHLEQFPPQFNALSLSCGTNNVDSEMCVDEFLKFEKPRSHVGKSVLTSWCSLCMKSVGERNWIQTRQSLKMECFIFSVHAGLVQALSTTLGETTWIGEAAK